MYQTSHLLTTTCTCTWTCTLLCTCCYNTNVISDCIPLDKSVHYFTIFVYFVVLFLNLLVHFQAKLNNQFLNALHFFKAYRNFKTIFNFFMFPKRNFKSIKNFAVLWIFFLLLLLNPYPVKLWIWPYVIMYSWTVHFVQ